MTLADFLLARIAEDEADADVNLRGARDGVLEPAWGASAERVLAECEAKRRIVAEHEGAHNCVRYIDADDNRDCLTLRALAAVYADHPDYLDEWRP